MKISVASAALAAFIAISASTACLAEVDSSVAASSSEIANQFRGQGAWVFVQVMGGKDAIAAALDAGMVLTSLGLGAVAILARMRLQAVRAAQRANRQPYS